MIKNTRQAFTLIELLIALIALLVIVTAVGLVYRSGATVFQSNIVRTADRGQLSQALELIVRQLRQATVITELTQSSIKFTANSNSYYVYLYHVSDPLPNPPYTQSLYELRWVQGSTTYGAGATISRNIVAPVNVPFAQSGKLITIDLTAQGDGENIRLRTKVRPRNL